MSDDERFDVAAEVRRLNEAIGEEVVVDFGSDFPKSLQKYTKNPEMLQRYVDRLAKNRRIYPNKLPEIVSQLKERTEPLPVNKAKRLMPDIVRSLSSMNIQCMMVFYTRKCNVFFVRTPTFRDLSMSRALAELQEDAVVHPKNYQVDQEVVFFSRGIKRMEDFPEKFRQVAPLLFEIIREYAKCHFSAAIMMMDPYTEESSYYTYSICTSAITWVIGNPLLERVGSKEVKRCSALFPLRK